MNARKNKDWRLSLSFSSKEERDDAAEILEWIATEMRLYGPYKNKTISKSSVLLWLKETRDGACEELKLFLNGAAHCAAGGEPSDLVEINDLTGVDNA